MRQRTKDKYFCIRMTIDQFNRLSRACNRDELKPSLFAKDVLVEATENLIKKQEVEGYKCSQLI